MQDRGWGSCFFNIPSRLFCLKNAVPGSILALNFVSIQIVGDFMQKFLSFYYDFTLLSGAAFRSVVREFVDNGATRFVINDGLLKQMVQDPERVEFLHDVCRSMKVEFSSVHGLYSNEYDLNVPGKEWRPEMWARHKKALEIAAGFGCRTYTIHVGAYHYCIEHISLDTLRELALETLEELLPTAEKNGIIIAVENSFEKPNSAKEVLGLVNHFAGSPAIGVCYDTGHANCMASAPGKDKSKYESYFEKFWWEDGVIWEDHALETLKEHIVTCHIHDNTGYGDYHGMPFDGTIDWQTLMPKLFSCPKMIDYQTEVEFRDGKNWSGQLLAPVGGYSIRRVTDTFRRLGFDENFAAPAQ